MSIPKESMGLLVFRISLKVGSYQTTQQALSPKVCRLIYKMERSPCLETADSGMGYRGVGGVTDTGQRNGGIGVQWRRILLEFCQGLRGSQ